MAENPIKTPLTADLPEDWTAGQIVAPEGEPVGLSEQHGYNYLMQKVNEARRAVNTIGESFESIGGKRTCRFTVGASAAGWTAADCDYLCDGTDDQEEIQAAVNALPANGGEVVLLDGVYHLTGAILLLKNNTVLRGNGAATRLIRETAEGGSSVKYIIAVAMGSSIRDFHYEGGTYAQEGMCDIYTYEANSIENINFDCFGTGDIIKVDAAESSSTSLRIFNCRVKGSLCTFVNVNTGSGCIHIQNNFRSSYGGYFLKTSKDSAWNIVMKGNAGSRYVPTCGFILIDGLSPYGGTIIEGNCLTQLQILNSVGTAATNSNKTCGNIISGNIFLQHDYNEKFWPLILLGEKSNNNFVTGNMVLRRTSLPGSLIQDLGTNNIVRFNSDDLGGSTPATVEQAAPVLTVSAEGQVKATAVQQAGYVAAGTKSAALTLSAAQDPDFLPENIRKGVEIFGVEGQLDPGGGTAGVSSFNGRTGAVAPAEGDYTAEMVGAIPAESVETIQALTEEEYNALTEKSAATLYLIKE